MAKHSHEVIAPEPFQVPAKFRMLCIALVVVGAIGMVIGLAVDPYRAWNGYIIGFWFTLSLALAGPFIVSTQFLSLASWSMPIRRIPEAFGSFLVPALILSMFGFIALDAGLYHWTDAEYVAKDPVLLKKQGFLQEGWFIFATLATLITWIGIRHWQMKLSVEQDETGDYSLNNMLKVVSSIFLIAFVIGFSFMAWYWIMSLEPHWFSTMFSVYAFAGLFQSGLALTIILVLYFREQGNFGSFVGERQIHDLGQLLFGFTVFYAYIAFSQFLLIWYANIPEAGIWYVARGVSPEITTGWEVFTLALPVLKFAIPFFILLPQDHKKNKRNILKYVAYGLIVLQLYEVWYWVAPTPHEKGVYASSYQLPHVELLIIAGFVGLFALVVANSLTRRKFVPVKDPFLHEHDGHHIHAVKPPKPDHIRIS